MQTRSNATLLFAQADTAAARHNPGGGEAPPCSTQGASAKGCHPFYERMVSSATAGQSWGAPATQRPWVSAAPNYMYSEATGAVFRFETTPQPVKDDPAAVAAPSPVPPPIPPGKRVWATDLPKPAAKVIAAGATGLSKSTDDGRTWSEPALLQINGTLSPHYGGGSGLGHGVVLQHGPHKGRLVLARRYGSRGMSTAEGAAHSFVIYSDDDGGHWQAGQLLPEGWTECQATEMLNGSVLLTARMVGSPYLSQPGKLTDRRRGFARSDDGGHTWAEWWFLEDRQPDVFVGTCFQSITSDVGGPNPSGRIFFGHPGAVNGSRTNYTVHQSSDGGGSWALLQRVYAGGGGYSDINVLRKPGGGKALGVAFQKTFEPPDKNIEGGGYNMGFAVLDL